jgi:hypothetical protein
MTKKQNSRECYQNLMEGVSKEENSEKYAQIHGEEKSKARSIAVHTKTDIHH